MKYKNIFGELEYEIGKFFVLHRTGCTGKYKIQKRETWYVTDASLVDMNVIFPTPEFDSWIQAIRFLKENINDLI